MLCLLRETEIRKINEEEIVAWLAESEINGDIEAMERGRILENLDEVRWIVKDAKGSFHFGDSAMHIILINSVPPINWVVGYVLPFIYSFLPRSRESSKRADGKDRKRWERNENERTRKERKRKISKERTKAILGTGEAAALKRQLVWVRRAKRLVKKGAVTGVVVFLLVLTFAWNVNGIPKRKGFFPGSLRGVMWFTGLQQTWNMFSPNPPSINSWPVLEGKWLCECCGVVRGVVWRHGLIVPHFIGELNNKSVVELWGGPGGLTAWKGRPMTFQPPHPFKDPFKNHRGFKYVEAAFLRKPDQTTLKYYARYVCREWDKHQSHLRENLNRIAIWKVSRRYAYVDGFRRDYDLHKNLLMEHECWEAQREQAIYEDKGPKMI